MVDRKMDYSEKARQLNKQFRKAHPGFNKDYWRARITAVYRIMGSKCFVHNCQANNDPEEIRFAGLNIHHLEQQHYQKHQYRTKKSEQQNKTINEILSGNTQGKQLLCGYHHGIADKLGKKKWLEFLKIKNAGIELLKQEAE